jgi:cation-transporting ATPase E
LRFAVPAGAAAAGATFVAYYLARADGGSSLDTDQTTAAVTLFAIALWVLAIVARPYTWWRVGLVALMALLFVLVLALPFGRDFFDLHPDDTHLGIGLASAAIAAVVLEIAWRVLATKDSR